MNLKTTIVLLALVVAGAIGWLAVALRAPRETASPTVEFLDNQLKADRVRRLEITRGENVVVLERADAKSEWFLPGKWPVRDKEIEQLVHTLTSLHTRFAPTPLPDDAQRKEYGLTSDALTVKVTLEGDGQTHTLRFGEQPGDVNRFSRPTYLQLDEKKEVVRLQPGLIAQLGRSQDYFLQRRLFPYQRVAKAEDSLEKVEELKAKEIVISAPAAKFTLEQKNGKWEIAAPVHDRTDPEKIKSLLRAFPDIWAERFIDKSEVKVKETGLDKPEFVLKTTRPGGESVELFVGNVSRSDVRKVAKPQPPFGGPPMPQFDFVKTEYRYAKLRDNEQVFEIKADKLQDVAQPLANLRDPMLARFKVDDVRRVVIKLPKTTILLTKAADKDAWRMEQPIALDAESNQVTELIRKLSDLEAKEGDVIDKADLDKVGLKKPLATVTLDIEEKGKDDKQSTRQITFELGKEAKEKDKLFARVEGWPRVNIVKEDVLKLVERPALAYRSRKLLDVAASDIDRIDIRRDGDAFTFEQVKGTWKPSAPVNAELQSSKVASLAGDLARLEAVEFVSADPKAEELKEYGLADPKLEVKVQVAKDKKTHTLVLGNKRKDKEEYYARLDNGPVFVVAKALQSDLDRDSLSYRDDKLWDLEAKKIGEVVIHKDDPEYRLKREGKGWQITGPFTAPASESLAESLVDRVSRLQAEKFVAHLAKDLTKYGLEKPYLRVRIPPVDKDAKEHVLVVGKEADTGRYAKTNASESVFIVDAKTLEAIDRTSFELLDKKLLDLDADKIKSVKIQGKDAFALEPKDKSWQVVGAPAPTFTAEEDAAQDYLRGLAHLQAQKFVAYGPKVDLATYGLDKPATTITITSEDADKKTKTHTIELGKADKDGAPYARLDKGPGVFVFAPATAKELAKTHVDFVDPRLLKFDIDNVSTITRSMPGNDFELTKKGDAWFLLTPDRPADTITVESLLDQTFRLRAQRIAEYPAKDLAAYGLDKPAAVITFKLADPFGKKSEHVIKVGKATGKTDEGHYALVDEGKAVAVLMPKLSELLLASTLNYGDKNLANLSGVDEAVVERGPRKATFAKLLGEWKMTAPVSAETEKSLEDLIRSLSRLRADEMVAEKADPKMYGLDKPAAVWKLQSGKKDVLDLTLGNEDKAGRRYAKLAGRDLVFLLSAPLSKRLLEEYRQRDIFTGLDAAQVEQLAYITPDAKFTLKKDGTNWSAAGKSDVKLDSAIVTDTLDALARLKALRYVVDAKANLQLYGLQPPLWTVTAETPSGKKVLSVGRTEGTSKNYYASVTGADAVFLIAEADASRILRSLESFAVPMKKETEKTE